MATSLGTGGGFPWWAMPGELAAGDRHPLRRTARDWAADAGLFLFAVLWWTWTYYDYVVNPDPRYLAIVDDWMVAADPYLGAALCLALWWRRRFPLALAIAAVVCLIFSSTASGAVLVALFTVAVHRGWLPAVLVTAGAITQAVGFSVIYQPPGVPRPVFMVYAVLMFTVPLGWGMVVRFRRQLLLSLRQDAQRERDEHAQKLVAARRAEREQIAREMHDVLAHRISLLSVHAGALAYRTSQAGTGAGQALTSAEVGEAITVIRDNAHQALTELGEVLSVLRAGDPAAATRQAPQPLLVDLPQLVAEARSAGQRVTLDLPDGALEALPVRPLEQRTAYRVVQEGLTNARKHAPDAAVAVRVAAEPGRGLDVVVANALPVGVTSLEIPGAGAGLTGLAERVALDGGTLEHGAVDGSFRLAAHLPGRT